ncbi:alpha-2,3-sialyltransferase [Helicobacter sp. 11S02629-2]|uniref:alpha-2,3-sialyltransferase n=1 Tax=Helicobacter sp. 11S02629-2 TaxID=1476195 RepID=UPI000BA79C1E|nr:alpha-2,3-sialyltransferase [Helicobacter sp. 11S02629-2]PAF43116.1 hypothetical protein BKH40_07315 [Helicobacter sp. 11S02629-2]
MKAVLIAGNGESLKDIDFKRMPKDIDVFRVNQFYFEDSYLTGKKIKAVFFNPTILKEQFLTMKTLVLKGEYEIENYYCTLLNSLYIEGLNPDAPKIDVYALKKIFPEIRHYYEYLEKIEEFNYFVNFSNYCQDTRPTSGIAMIFTAIALGYTEIYVAGIDLYGGTKYAFNYSSSKLAKFYPRFSYIDQTDPNHSKDIDLKALRLASRYLESKRLKSQNNLADNLNCIDAYGETSFDPKAKVASVKLDSMESRFNLANLLSFNAISSFSPLKSAPKLKTIFKPKVFGIYSVSKSSAINEILPLAPLRFKHDFKIAPKPEGYIKDILTSAKKDELEAIDEYTSRLKKLMESKGAHKEVAILKSSLWYQLYISTYVFSKALYALVKKLLSKKSSLK